jgi:hypothetical protein
MDRANRAERGREYHVQQQVYRAENYLGYFRGKNGRNTSARVERGSEVAPRSNLHLGKERKKT